MNDKFLQARYEINVTNLLDHFWNWVNAGVAGVGPSHLSLGEGFEQDGFAWCSKLRVVVIVQRLDNQFMATRVERRLGFQDFGGDRWTTMRIYHGSPYD